MTTSRKPIRLENVKPGIDPTRLIVRLYSEGRTCPREQPAHWPARPAVNRSAAEQHHSRAKNDPGNFQVNQAPENFHASNYDQDTSGWVRSAPNGKTPTGNNETATKCRISISAEAGG